MPSNLTARARAMTLRLQGAEIRRGRLAHNLKQQEAADLCDVALITYQCWEYARHIAPAAIRERLAEAWGLNRGLLGLDPDHTCPACGRDYST